MTRAHVNAWVSRAKSLIADGDCASAHSAIAQAWQALGQYSAQLARQGASNGTAVYLHKTIAKLQTRLAQRCADALAPVYQDVPTGADPDALAPIRGTGDVIFDSLQTTLTTLGMIGAVFGLGYGIYITYKRSGGA
jgi:hypothetical protein